MSNVLQEGHRPDGQSSSQRALKKDMMLDESLERSEPTGLLFYATGKGGRFTGARSSHSTINGSIGDVEFYGSLGGYACSQPVLYYQCHCPTFCRMTANPNSALHFIELANGNIELTVSSENAAIPVNRAKFSSSYYANEYGGYGYQRGSRWRPHKRHRKKKFRFETIEEEETTELPELHLTTQPPRSSTVSWEDEEEWERKFVTSKSRPSPTSEEFPEIESAEITGAKSRIRDREKVVQQPSSFGEGPENQGTGGVGVGSGIGVGGIGVSSGLNVGAPGIGGLGNGGIFGISSGLGVGVPGVGPIGVSSGIGVGR
ncbi:unnamed protein product [Angiostrongylus costaricensis]|uniref:Glycine-rich protein n=1 Tax=Angiostrongylus costaricensis TaxID=334426 RepID=A0A158PE15_ANGCS|nr:unnamed protein product [Angiostrongylus costaricensis]